MTEFEKFAPMMRKRGFRKVWSSGAGGIRTDEWTVTIGERQVDVQISADGKHRVSHSIRGRSTTMPTAFHDEQSMDDAIQKEFHRRDSEAFGTSDIQ